MQPRPWVTRVANWLFCLCLGRRRRWLWPIVRPAIRLLEVFES